MIKRRAPIQVLADVERMERANFSDAVPSLTVYDLLASAARAAPQRPAIHYLESSTPGEPVQTLTHREFFARVTQIANLLADLGVAEGDSVALLSNAHPDAHCALWAAEIVGVACPLNSLLQPREVTALLQACRAKVLVIPGRDRAPDLWERAMAVSRQATSLHAVVILGQDRGDHSGHYCLDAHLTRYPTDRLVFSHRKAPDDRAAMFHTGGTTGMPKLAVHSQRGQAFVAWALARMMNLDSEDVFMNGLPIFHVGGTIDFGLAPLSVGGSIVIPSAAGMRHPNSIRHHWRIVEQQRITVLSGVPTSFAALLNTQADAVDISSVRAGISGGSALPEGVAQEFERRFGVRIFQLYGMTETSGLVSISSPDAAWVPMSAGFRLPFTSIRIGRPRATGDGYEDCASGESGSVLVKGPHVFAGYLDGDRTAVSPQGWFATGDLGYLSEEGRLHLTGRAKDVIIRSGHNIDPQIIEEIACRHPSVELCAAVGMPNEYAGEVPVAYVTLKAGTQASAAEIGQFIAQHIAEPPARPREVFIIPAMPTTAVGKIFKPGLRCDAVSRGIRLALDATGLSAEVSVEDRSSLGFVARIRLNRAAWPQARQKLSLLQIRFELVD